MSCWITLPNGGDYSGKSGLTPSMIIPHIGGGVDGGLKLLTCESALCIDRGSGGLSLLPCGITLHVGGYVYIG